jgi:hypothetical protein
MVLGTGQLQHKEKEEAVANGLEARGNFKWRSLSSTPFLRHPDLLVVLGHGGRLLEITRGS